MNPDSRSLDRGDSIPDVTRLVVYALASRGAALDPAVRTALEGLREHAARLVVVTSTSVSDADRADLRRLADRVQVGSGDAFRAEFYSIALADESVDDFDEILFTGDSWFGPVGEFAPVLERMSAEDADFWRMVENRHGPLREFPRQGFPRQTWPWSWVMVRRTAVASAPWVEFWSSRRAATDDSDSEQLFVAALEAAGLRGGYAFTTADFPDEHPAIFSAELLMDAGCPIVDRSLFGLYPPFLQQHAIVGREIVGALEKHGYPLSSFWPTLARTVPPKALNTNAGMLDILPAAGLDPEWTPRIVVIAYVSDVALAPELREKLDNLPSGYDLVITTNDGVKARQLRAIWENAENRSYAHFEVRVTPAGGGRDMSDFFVACRDVILSDRYDLIVKVHARRNRGKTVNLRRYFRRYQWENLLDSPEHVAGIIRLFETEPGLGLVFPPMIHIGYSTMGRGWSVYRDAAAELLEEMRVTVPQDLVSPLAPYGAMWVARPAALRSLAARGWTYRDYRGPANRDLARVQERIVVSVAAQDGFHSRTVLTRSHAGISHTALEFKADEMLATTTGYPVDQVALMHRAGPTGRGGIVGLSRMYLRLNHPVISRAVLPPMALAERVFMSTQRARRTAVESLRGWRVRPTRGGRR